MGAILRRVGSVLLATVLVALLLGLGTLFWLVRREGWLVQTVATGSMAPTVPTGSLILSRPVDASEIEVGDVIVFRSPTGATVSGGDDGVFTATESMLITHRVVEVKGAGADVTFRTRGDANADEDPWDVTPAMVRARYVAHVPAVGEVLSLPATRRWLFLGVAAIGCAVIAAELRSMAREVRSRRGGDVEVPEPAGAEPTEAEPTEAEPTEAEPAAASTRSDL